MLFTECSTDQMEVIKSYLQQFCDSSGENVGVEKTKIFFSKNVSREWANYVSVNNCLRKSIHLLDILAFLSCMMELQRRPTLVSLIKFGKD